MPDRATEDLVAAEVRKQTNPIWLLVLVALVFAMLLTLLLTVIHLWNSNQVQDAWLASLRSKVQSLEDQSWFSEEIDKQQELIEAIAEKLGIEAEDSDDQP